MPNASNNSARNKGESAGMRSWRSVITPPCQRKSTAAPIRIARHANYLCFAVDANGVAEKVPDESILNGFMWAAWGVYDYFLATKDRSAQHLFAKAVQTLRANLARYNLGF